MLNNYQIPTPVEYAKKMLDYAGYKKDLFGKKILYLKRKNIKFEALLAYWRE